MSENDDDLLEFQKRPDGPKPGGPWMVTREHWIEEMKQALREVLAEPEVMQAVVKAAMDTPVDTPSWTGENNEQ